VNIETQGAKSNKKKLLKVKLSTGKCSRDKKYTRGRGKRDGVERNTDLGKTRQ